MSPSSRSKDRDEKIRKRNRTRDQLRRLGFDRSWYDQETGYFRVACSQCQAMTVNGTPLHEKGCPKKRDGGQGIVLTLQSGEQLPLALYVPGAPRVLVTKGSQEIWVDLIQVVNAKAKGKGRYHNAPTVCTELLVDARALQQQAQEEERRKVAEAKEQAKKSRMKMRRPSPAKASTPDPSPQPAAGS
jgi:hypothetical protein